MKRALRLFCALGSELCAAGSYACMRVGPLLWEASAALHRLSEPPRDVWRS